MKKNYTKLAFVCGALFLGSVQYITAQQIKGTVITEDGAMPGVIVSIPNQNKNTATELDGSFSLIADEEGDCELVLSFIGYTDKKLQLKINKGLNNLGPIKLEADDSVLDEVVIKSPMANSQAKAYSIKMNSQAIMDVVAADAMGKLPDRNAAEAVQRIQGVAVARYHGEADAATVRGTPFSWTSTLFNGNRLPSSNIMGNRSTVLDAVPSELIQYVQVSKAITPDMDGDAIGGSINFITRTAPFSKKLGGSLAGGYNDFSGKTTYNGSLVYGDRFLNNKLGVILVGAIWDRQWGSDAFDVKYNTGSKNENERNAINNVMFKRYMGKRQTYGVNLGLEYEFNADHKVYFRGLYDKFNDIRPVYESYIDYSKSRYQYNYRYSYYQTRLTGGELGGVHSLSDKTKLDWSFSDYTSKYFLDTPSTTDKKGLPIASFYQPITGGFNNLSQDGLLYWGFDGGNAGYDPLKFTPGLKNPNETLNPEKLYLSSLTIMQLDNKENDIIAQINVKNELSDKLTFKGGFKFRTKLRNSTYGSLYTYAGKGDKLSDLNRKGFSKGNGYFTNMKGDYNYYALAIDPLTKNQLYQLFTPDYLKSHNFQDYTPATNPTNVYEARENVYAGYVMATYKATDALTVTGGLRNEYTTTKLTGTKASTDQNTKQTVLSASEIKNDYNVFLPMLHLRYNLDESSNLRFAYTKTFNRANFGDMTPGESINTTGADVVITRGNPDLKPTISNNLDLMYERYFDNVGLLSGGVFYKKIKNVIFTNESQFTQNNSTYIVKEAKNLEDATVAGLEIGMNRRFDFLPGFWSGFGIEANYTFIDSKVNVPRQYRENGQLLTVTDKTSLPDQSKHLGNIILFYEKGKVMVRLAGNYRGKSINAINQNLGKDYYVWTDSNFTLDASATFTLNKKIKFFVELNNLTNEPLKQYMGDKRRITSYEWYGVKGQVGARIDIF
ncbi:TonB-dependent receptor [Myroides marinus]|uniref:TonB-dependent receptor n=1 Tax=Myroides marinus TaxID=703342 RepID=A0A1H6VX72_9FLAO|nr:TonB-dependent receptor [Myroides marinus]SEJ05220.1 TonB-dependent receptor [Myroides marinus]